MAPGSCIGVPSRLCGEGRTWVCGSLLEVAVSGLPGRQRSVAACVVHQHAVRIAVEALRVLVEPLAAGVHCPSVVLPRAMARKGCQRIQYGVDCRQLDSRIFIAGGAHDLDCVKLQLRRVHCTELGRREADLSLAVLPHWRQRGPFLHSMNHHLRFAQGGQRIRRQRAAGVAAERIELVLHGVPRERILRKHGAAGRGDADRAERQGCAQQHRARLRPCWRPVLRAPAPSLGRSRVRSLPWNPFPQSRTIAANIHDNMIYVLTSSILLFRF